MKIFWALNKKMFEIFELIV